MAHAIILDCEFLTDHGAMQRFWCGPRDPDPVVAQIGAVALSLTSNFEIADRFGCYVRPRGREGQPLEVSALMTDLTGITNQDIAKEGLPLAEALSGLDRWTDGADIWSWGKDEFNLIAISAYVEGIAPPIPITRFHNACDLLLRAGMPYEDLVKTRSNTLASYFGVAVPDARAHDARSDALSVALVLQQLLRDGRLTERDFYQSVA